jgi:release factor glutamine methyltransferase
MTIREALASGSAVLKTAGIESHSLDASLLLAEVLNAGRSSLIAAASDPLAEEAFAAYGDLIKRRLAGECAAYILGKKEFFGLEFLVNPSVLVPRPETETLVDLIIMPNNMHGGKPCPLKECDTARAPTNAAVCDTGGLALARPVGDRTKNEPVRVLDLCTGSGAIAIALKHEMPELEVWAADISAEALETAKANAARLLPPDSIRFFHGDIYKALPQLFTFHFSLFTVIVSNPPYIPTAEIAGLSPEVRAEPAIALDGGGDGLDIIRRIVAGAPDFLCPGGVLLLEADPRQMNEIACLYEKAGFTDISTYNDLAGEKRVIGGKKPETRKPL